MTLGWQSATPVSLLDALMAAGRAETPAALLIERFVAIAQRDINALPVPLAARGLLVGFGGYCYTSNEIRLFLRTVTNLDETSNPTDTFRLQETPDGEAMPPAYMQAYGTY
ncbi:MAG: hypothetical protein M0014_13760, partial [Actinomycetota bacterium]|nr:hypothetical protein [Actinomycetota bacterium]